MVLAKSFDYRYLGIFGIGLISILISGEMRLFKL